ncbi:MAG: hydrogen gas-evolving membrane-bound hydrogenase subunit E [Chloroflexota bacterium]
MALLFVLLLVVGYRPVIVEQGALSVIIPWVPEYGLSLSFYLDGLSLLFGLIITGIGAVIFVYAGAYFDEPDDRTRFQRTLLLFTAAMLWLVLSGNLITLFIAWELTSITSFLLIGFKGAKYASARAGAARALVVTGGGGLALLAGLMLLGNAGGSYELSELLTMDLTGHTLYTPAAILIMLGAFTKSAQFPFHFWLPGAMDAPTPASSFLHSATMVKAGVYLLLRLHPTLGDTPLWTGTLLTVGLFTMFLSSLLAVRQADLKGVLAFTTTAQLGVLVALIGIPEGYGIKAAMVGILGHALYKSALFLGVGSIDHATGTRLVSKLGGLWKHMPITGVVVIISALSMAGMPPLMGFVAKETLLEATVFSPLILGIVFVSAALTGTAGYILIWDVFFGETRGDWHFHALPRVMETGPIVMVVGTVSIGFLLGPLLLPLLTPMVPVEFKLVLFPGFNNIFWMSMGALAAGFALFFLRDLWRRVPDFPLNATTAYNGVIAGSEWIADQALKTQNGKLRHYLMVVIGVVMAILLYGGLIRDLLNSPSFAVGTFTIPDILDVMLLVLAVGAAWSSVAVRRHLHAALALAIFGYAVGGVFLVELAPDVALVQFLVETLATVVLIIMISRVTVEQRQEAMNVLKRTLDNRHDAVAKVRDITVAVVTGVVMTAFALVALINRENRDSIAAWHFENAEPQVGVTDVVSAILTDFRGTDTFVEIGVFSIAALGLLALLTINRNEDENTSPAIVRYMYRDSLVATPFIRAIAALLLPLTLVIAAVHILYGANAPGDGFTAGIVAGLGVALYYVVFGYEQVRLRLRWVHPTRLITAGLLLAFVNATLPILVGGQFMGLLDFAPWLDLANLKFNTTVVFEIAIATTVFGGVSLIMETIAYPSGVPAFNRATGEYPAADSTQSIPADATSSATGD